MNNLRTTHYYVFNHKFIPHRTLNKTTISTKKSFRTLSMIRSIAFISYVSPSQSLNPSCSSSQTNEFLAIYNAYPYRNYLIPLSQ